MRPESSRETRLTDAFVGLADSLVSGYGVVELLHNLIDHCLDLVDASAAGLVLRDPSGGLKVLASSSEDTWLLELLQRLGEGPCVECYATGQLVTIDDMSMEAGRWTRFQAAARAEGFRSVHAVPMRLRADTIGAMNLFSTGTGPLPDADARVVRALTDVATIAILQERALTEHAIVRDQLQGALNSRVIIEQAKGVLAHQGNLDMDTAFSLMRSYARRRNEHLRDVAAAIVNANVGPAVLTRQGPDRDPAKRRPPTRS